MFAGFKVVLISLEFQRNLRTKNGLKSSCCHFENSILFNSSETVEEQ